VELAGTLALIVKIAVAEDSGIDCDRNARHLSKWLESYDNYKTWIVLHMPSTMLSIIYLQ